VELRHLRYFLAVAEYSHFRLAAEALLVSQPTLSEQIKELEKELGVDLFIRIGRRVRLSQAGESFQGYARRVFATLDEAQVVLHEFNDLLRGVLRVGVIQTVASYLMPQVAAEFAKKYPAVQLKIEMLTAGQIENGLSAGGLDLGISFTLPNNSDLTEVELLSEQFVYVTSSEHPLSKRKRLRLEEIAEYDLCLLPNQFCTRQLIDAAFRQINQSPSITIETSTIESCVDIAIAGGPATIVPELAVNRLDYPFLRIEQPAIRRKICLLQRTGSQPLRASAAFKAIVMELIRT
jgi:LysR family cyn operon transcriptional activator